MNVEQIITSYGYPAIFIGTFFEGETVLVLAGFLAHRGYIELPWVILAAFLGTLFGDQLYFYIGRQKGLNFIEARPQWKDKMSRVSYLLRKRQVLLIIGFRFIYGMRTVTPFVLGASKVDPVLFFVLNVLGAGLWTLIICMLGYFVGQSAEYLLEEVKRYEFWVIFIIMALGSFVWFIYWVRNRR